MVNYSAFHWSEKARKYAETIGTIFNVKGRVNTVADLPSTGNKVGDLYLVGLPTDADLIEYAWLSFDNVTRWEKLGFTAISTSFAALTGSPYDNTALGNALGDKYDASNPDGYITGITSAMVTTALGYTPYNSSNPSGYISGITSAMVTTALGYTPYNSTNPSGYQANVIETVKVNGTALTPTNKEVDVTVPTVNNSTITLTQGGVIKGSFTLNQSTASTIALDAGGGSPLPSQTGQSGKFLTTDGTDASWGNIPSDSTKANTSLDNINASASAKETIVGWGMPDYTSGISISATPNTIFQVQEDGFFLMSCNTPETLVYCYFEILDSDNNVLISTFGNTCRYLSHYGSLCSAFLPVKNGQKIKIGSVSGVTLCAFFPCIGG